MAEQQTAQQTQQTNDQQPQQNQDGPRFTQADLDRIVQDRLARDRAKYSDYEDLVKFKQEHEQKATVAEQKALEEQKQYEKLKENWNSERTQLSTKINELNQQIQGEKISNTLTNEIFKKNAYPEAVQLLKPMVKYNDDGTMTIRGKDANGIDTDLSVEQGVEQFLKDRPYLVKGSGQGGAGTGSGQGSGAGGQADQNDLSKQLQNAMAAGDRKKVNELKGMIRAKHANTTFIS